MILLSVDFLETVNGEVVSSDLRLEPEALRKDVELDEIALVWAEGKKMVRRIILFPGRKHTVFERSIVTLCIANMPYGLE